MVRLAVENLVIDPVVAVNVPLLLVKLPLKFNTPPDAFVINTPPVWVNVPLTVIVPVEPLRSMVPPAMEKFELVVLSTLTWKFAFTVIVPV